MELIKLFGKIGKDCIENNDERGAVAVIDALGDLAISAINAMSPLDIAESNVRWDFGENEELHEHALKCVLLVASKHDPRDLTIAFSNQLTIWKPNDVDWSALESHVRRGVNPHPMEVVKEAMDWLTEMAVKHTPFWVKWNCQIPKAALETSEDFRDFSKGFDPSQCLSIEELKSKGRK